MTATTDSGVWDEGELSGKEFMGSKEHLLLQGSSENSHIQNSLKQLSVKSQEERKQFELELAQDYSAIVKLFEEFLAVQHTTLCEAFHKSCEMDEILKSAGDVDCSKQAELVDYMNACFSSGHWIRKSVNYKAISDIKNLINSYIRVDYGEILKLKSIVNKFLHVSKSSMQDSVSASTPNRDMYLVAVTHVINPGEFYVIRWCDREKYEEMSNILDAEASEYPEPSQIVSGQMYAVCSSDKWYRGMCGQQCGIYQKGDSPPQKLYSFFFVDDGRVQSVPSSFVRCLPQKLMDIPKLALQCTLNPDFKSTIFNMEITTRFKQATRRNPMSMKVLSQEGGMLNVDLDQIPCFGEDTCIESLRKSLFPIAEMREEKPFRNIKAKFDFGATGYVQPKALRVVISHAQNPANIYVNVVDEEWAQFEQMHKDMQAELGSALPESPQDVSKGHLCAAKYDNQWYRVLVEDIFRGQVAIFYVDTGHRHHVSREDCFPLPDKFLELPAQSLRCVLDGLKSTSLEERNPAKPYSNPKWGHKAVSYLQQAINKKGILCVENFAGRMVGKINRSAELTAYSILYLDEEEFSINRQLYLKGYAICRKRTVAANIDALRLEMAPEVYTSNVTLAGDTNFETELSCEDTEHTKGTEEALQKTKNQVLCEDIPPLQSSSEDLPQSAEVPSLDELSHQHDLKSPEIRKSSTGIYEDTFSEEGESKSPSVDASSSPSNEATLSSLAGMSSGGAAVRASNSQAQLRESPKSFDTGNSSVFRTEIKKLLKASTKSSEQSSDSNVSPPPRENRETVTSEEAISLPDSKLVEGAEGLNMESGKGGAAESPKASGQKKKPRKCNKKGNNSKKKNF